jgi:hypothetical protein
MKPIQCLSCIAIGYGLCVLTAALCIGPETHFLDKGLVAWTNVVKL